MKCPGCGGRELEPDGEGLLRCEGCGEIIDGETPAEKVATLLGKLRTEAKVL